MTDSVGYMLPDEVREKTGLLRSELNAATELGFHCHHNLAMGVGNSLAAVEAGANRIDGSVVGFGAGAAILGHPAASVAMLANMLSERDEVIPAGSFIMTGGITAPVSVTAGDSVCVRYQELGTVNLNFV